MEDEDNKETKVKMIAQEIKDFISEMQGLRKAFSDFVPEVRSIQFDYRAKTSEIRFFINIPRGLVRKLGKRIVLPVYPNYVIHEIIDLDSGASVPLIFERDSNQWIIRTKDMPNSERFLISTKGNVTSDFLHNWVKVTAPLNSKSDGDNEKYWLHATLRDVSVIEEIYDAFSVDNIDVGVKVGVKRLFSAALPKKLSDRLNAHRDFIESARGRSRGDWIKKAGKYREELRKSGPEVMEFVEFVGNLVSGDYFRDFIQIDDPFQIANIEAKQDFVVIPESVSVDVFSKLTLDVPVVEGYLLFERNRYDKAIKLRIDKEFGKKSK
jgi:hypothetical protein